MWQQSAARNCGCRGKVEDEHWSSGIQSGRLVREVFDCDGGYRQYATRMGRLFRLGGG